MELKITKVTLAEIRHFRALFLCENNVQFVHHAFHERGWSDCYLLFVDGTAAGYGAVGGREQFPIQRNTVFEFYLIPPYRPWASRLFPLLLSASNAVFIECQSNDKLMAPMLHEFAENINAEALLFEDHTATQHYLPDVIFRPKQEGEYMDGRRPEDLGAYVLEVDGHIAASGGFLLHYNPPFADLYMEVHKRYRQQGLGSFILQEIKKECYRAGRVPAARCNVANKASKASLLRAGMQVCGAILAGSVKVSG